MDDLYANIMGRILALDYVPPPDKIFNMDQQEENHKRMMRNRKSRDNVATAFAVTHHGRTSTYGLGIRNPCERVSCKHCGRLGHEQSNYFEIIGHLSGWGTRGRGRGQGGCGTCGGRSSAGGGRGDMAHAIMTKTGPSSTTTEIVQSTVPRFTAEHV